MTADNQPIVGGLADPHVRARLHTLRKAARGELGAAGWMLLATQLGPIRPAIPTVLPPGQQPPAPVPTVTRYTLLGLGCRLDVGWDAFAGSYYALVWDPKRPGPPQHLGGGGRWRLRTVHELAAAVARHTPLPTGVVAVLVGDREEFGDCSATPADAAGSRLELDARGAA